MSCMANELPSKPVFPGLRLRHPMIPECHSRVGVARAQDATVRSALETHSAEVATSRAPLGGRERNSVLGQGIWPQVFHQLNGGEGVAPREGQWSAHTLPTGLVGWREESSLCVLTQRDCSHLPVLFFTGRLCTRTSATAAISELFPSRLLTRSMILSVISLIGFPSSRMSSADWGKRRTVRWRAGAALHSSLYSNLLKHVSAALLHLDPG